MGVITKTSTKAWRATATTKRNQRASGRPVQSPRQPHFPVRDGLGVQESDLETLAKSLQQMSEDEEATSNETHSRAQPRSANLPPKDKNIYVAARWQGYTCQHLQVAHTRVKDCLHLMGTNRRGNSQYK